MVILSHKTGLILIKPPNLMFKKLLMLTYLFLFILTSCSEELPAEFEIDSQTIKKNAIEAQNVVTKLNPCSFDLNDLEADKSINISCLVDLKGKNIDLKPRVQVNYDGGDIINGTLTFHGGKIDGRFLNKSLTVGGDVQLKDPVFNFNPQRWDIQEGQINSRTAFSNRLNIEKVINTVKSLGADTFKIGKFDAYFDVITNTNTQNSNFETWKEGINIPGDFTLHMSPETHLRVYPNNYKKYALLAVYNERNVQIIGGTLHGDRDEHNYSDGGSHEWGHLMLFKSAVDSKVEGLTMKNATGDGLKVESTGFTFQSYYKPSKNITITGCVFDSNRRNNLAVTDGYHIIIENNQFFRAGIDTPNSKGTNPRYAIDIEAYRKRDDDGKIINFEMVEDVIIRNNTQKGSGRGGFIVSSGDNVLIENNYVENGIAFTQTQNTVIRNNTIISNGENNSSGISAGGKMYNMERNNEVKGNYIKGFDYGIHIGGTFQKISDNKIENCNTGMGGRYFTNSKIVGNEITSIKPNSRGIFVFYGYVNRVLFKDNFVDTPNNPFKFEIINLEKGQEEFCAHLVNNTFSSSSVGLLLNTTGISLMKNTIKTGLEIFDSKNFSVEDNTITSKKWDGIYLRKRNTSVRLSDNQIEVPENKNCIKIQNTTDSKDVRNIDNKCVD